VLLWLASWIAAASPVPQPSVDRIDYGSPAAALVWPETLGSRAPIEHVAAGIGGARFGDKLSGIDHWMDEHLTYDPELAYRWRSADTVIAEGAYGGCADYALVYGALARELGIPVVWVKTMDAGWIRAFVRGPEPDTWSGHVFLELYDGERWMLLDPQRQALYEDYDPRARILPGDRFAYDKGVDPYELVLSGRWPEWKEQTRAYFRDFDLAQLPVPPGRSVDGPALVFIAGDNPGFDVAAERITAGGGTLGPSGNVGFEQWMPSVTGHTLVVLSVAGRDVLPEPYRTRYVGARFSELRRQHVDERWWVDRRVGDDGTEVVLVYGADERALEQAIAKIEIDD